MKSYLRIKNSSQSIIEYSLLLSFVVAAIFTMQVYCKRGIQAAIKMASDDLGPQTTDPLTSAFPAVDYDPEKGGFLLTSTLSDEDIGWSNQRLSADGLVAKDTHELNTVSSKSKYFTAYQEKD